MSQRRRREKAEPRSNLRTQKTTLFHPKNKKRYLPTVLVLDQNLVVLFFSYFGYVCLVVLFFREYGPDAVEVGKWPYELAIAGSERAVIVEGLVV